MDEPATEPHDDEMVPAPMINAEPAAAEDMQVDGHSDEEMKMDGLVSTDLGAQRSVANGE